MPFLAAHNRPLPFLNDDKLRRIGDDSVRTWTTLGTVFLAPKVFSFDGMVSRFLLVKGGESFILLGNSAWSYLQFHLLGQNISICCRASPFCLHRIWTSQKTLQKVKEPQPENLKWLVLCKCHFSFYVFVGIPIVVLYHIYIDPSSTPKNMVKSSKIMR